MDKRFLWLVIGCLEYHRPIISNACPLKQSQKSLHPQLVPFSLEFLKWVFQLVDFVLLIAKTTKSPYFGYWSRISAHKGFCPQELEALEKTFRSFMTNSLTFLSVRLKDVAIFGRWVFFLWSLSAFFVIFSNASRALPPSSVDVSHIFSIFLWRKKICIYSTWKWNPKDSERFKLLTNSSEVKVNCFSFNWKSRLCLFIVDNRKWRTFYKKDNNGKLWVESDRFFFPNAVATVDVLTASNNDVKLVETWTVHFANSKLYYRFERINKLDCDYSY